MYQFLLYQACIATHESNGLSIVTALILNDINPLGRQRMDLVLELKNNASKLLLAIMESRTSGEKQILKMRASNSLLDNFCFFFEWLADSEMNVAEKIIYNLNPKQLIEVACKLYHQDTLEEDGDDDMNEVEDSVSPKTVGHNIYILCHQQKKIGSICNVMFLNRSIYVMS